MDLFVHAFPAFFLIFAVAFFMLKAWCWIKASAVAQKLVIETILKWASSNLGFKRIGMEPSAPSSISSEKPGRASPRPGFFHALKLALIIGTHLWYPHGAPIVRYDALVTGAVLIQIALRPLLRSDALRTLRAPELPLIDGHSWQGPSSDSTSPRAPSYSSCDNPGAKPVSDSSTKGRAVDGRIVDVMEESVRFTVLLRPCTERHYSERKEAGIKTSVASDLVTRVIASDGR